MNESIRKYWFVEARQENGQMNRVSEDCHTVNYPRAKARGLVARFSVKKSFKVLNKYQQNPKEEISAKDKDTDLD